MSTLLERIQAKKAAANKKQEATNGTDSTSEENQTEPETETRDTRPEQPDPTPESAPAEEASQSAEVIATDSTEAKPEKPQQAAKDSEVIMGVTVEDLQQRINHVFEHAKSAEKHEIKEDMDGLKRAIHENPSIVQHLLPEDIGRMVGVLRKIHSEARVEANQTPAKKKAAKSAETKAAKEMMKKPLSQEDLNDLMDEL